MSRKRKAAAAGPFVLDWGALLGEDDESHKDLYLQRLCDKELADKISRAEYMLGSPSIFPDGGGKLRVTLKMQVAEWERRKLLKADGKRAKASLLSQHKPIRIDAIDELASPLMALRTQKIGLSSRTTLSKSPSNLSNHMNDSSKPNLEHFGRHSFTPSHCQPDKNVSGYFEKKENAPRVQPMHSSKTNNIERPFVLVDDEELEVDAVNQVDQSLPDIDPIPERMTISEQAQFGTALLGRALDAFTSARGGFLQLEAKNKKLTQHNSVLVKDNKSFQSEVNSLKSALAAQTARAKRAGVELAQAERDLWIKEKEELIAAHQAELEAVREKSRAEGYKQGQDELKGLQTPF